MQTQTPQLPKELASNRNFDDYLLAMKINAIIRYLKSKESAINELCRRVNAMGESTHSELKPTQCEMCQAVNELAPSLSYCPKHKYSVETTSLDEEVERIMGVFNTLWSCYEIAERDSSVFNKCGVNVSGEKEKIASWLRSTLLSFGKQQREAGEKAGYRKGVEAALEEVQTRVEGSWPEAIKAIKELIE